MASKLIKSKINTSNIYLYEFYYYEADDIFVFLGEKKVDSAQKGTVGIRTPYWTDIYDINRMSKGVSREKTPENPFGKKQIKVLPEKYKDNKIKVLVEFIEDANGEKHYINNELVERMDIDLSRFILLKIDEVIEDNPVISLEKDEGDKLAKDCYDYFSAIKKQKRDFTLEIPEPPSIVILLRLASMLNRSIEEIKRMDKRDIDSIMIMNQQEQITKNPAMIGMGTGGPGAQAMAKKGGGQYNMVFTGHNVQVNKPVHTNSVPASPGKS